MGVSRAGVAVLMAALVAVAVQGAAGPIGRAQPSVPALLWSGEDVEQQDSSSSDALYAKLDGCTESELTEAVVQLAGPQQARVAVLFLAEQLSTVALTGALGAMELEGEGAAAPALRSAMRDAAHSAVFPFVFQDAKPGTQQALSRWAFEHPDLSMTVGSAADLSPESLTKALGEKLAAAGADDQVRVVVLVPQTAADWDASVDSVMKVVSDQVGTKFMAVFTGSPAQPREPLETNVLLGATGQMARRKLATVTTLAQIPIRSTPQIMSGLLVTLVLGIAVVLYLCCLDDLQAPTRFAKAYPPMGKVYD